MAKTPTLKVRVLDGAVGKRLAELLAELTTRVEALEGAVEVHAEHYRQDQQWREPANDTLDNLIAQVARIERTLYADVEKATLVPEGPRMCEREDCPLIHPEADHANESFVRRVRAVLDSSPGQSVSKADLLDALGDL